MPDVFPYAHDKRISLGYEREQYESEPYTGDPKILFRGSHRRAWSLIFTNRTQVEFDAAATFYTGHPKPTQVTFRNYRFYPARDYTCWIVPNSFREQGSEVSFRFTYSFDVIEV